MFEGLRQNALHPLIVGMYEMQRPVIIFCKTGALKLVKKDAEIVPPKNMEEKFEIIMAGKKNSMGKHWPATQGNLELKP